MAGNFAEQGIAGGMNSLLVRGIGGLIVGYQYLVSPWIGPCCRFEPTCSSYAHHALRRHGLLKGGSLAVGRILKCHPFHPGGLDPVP